MEFGIFAHMFGCNFVDALVFGFSKKTLSKFVFVEEGNSWMRTIPTETTKIEPPRMLMNPLMVQTE